MWVGRTARETEAIGINGQRRERVKFIFLLCSHPGIVEQCLQRICTGKRVRVRCKGERERERERARERERQNGRCGDFIFGFFGFFLKPWSDAS